MASLARAPISVCVVARVASAVTARITVLQAARPLLDLAHGKRATQSHRPAGVGRVTTIRHALAESTGLVVAFTALVVRRAITAALATATRCSELATAGAH